MSTRASGRVLAPEQLELELVRVARAGPVRHRLCTAEAAFDRIERDNEPEWARFIDPAYLAGNGSTFGDVARPIESTRFAKRSAAEARHQIDLSLTVKSSRCTTAVRDLRARIQLFHTVSSARDFDERARLALAASHQSA